MLCIQTPAEKRSVGELNIPEIRFTDFDDDTQEVCGDIPCSLGEEHLENHHPEAPVSCTFSCLVPFKMSYALFSQHNTFNIRGEFILFLTPNWSSTRRLTAMVFSLSVSHLAVIGESGIQKY